MTQREDTMDQEPASETPAATATAVAERPVPEPPVKEERSLFNLVVPDIGILAVVLIVVLQLSGADFSATPEPRQAPEPDASGLIVLEPVSQVLTDEIVDAQLDDQYAIDLPVNTPVLIRMNAIGGERSGFDSELEVLGPNGTSVAYNDDIGGEFFGGFGLDSQVDFVTHEGGRHIIQAGALGGCCVGAYTLTIQVGDIDFAEPVPAPIPLIEPLPSP